MAPKPSKFSAWVRHLADRSDSALGSSLTAAAVDVRGRSAASAFRSAARIERHYTDRASEDAAWVARDVVDVVTDGNLITVKKNAVNAAGLFEAEIGGQFASATGLAWV